MLPPDAYLHLTYEQTRMSSDKLLAYLRWLLPNVPTRSETWKQLCHLTGAARMEWGDPVLSAWEDEWPELSRRY